MWYYNIPKSSSCDSLDFDVKPNAACQSVQLDTCIDSEISVVGMSGTSEIILKMWYSIEKILKICSN